jgi:hypothetical protein
MVFYLRGVSRHADHLLVQAYSKELRYMCHKGAALPFRYTVTLVKKMPGNQAFHASLCLPHGNVINKYPAGHTGYMFGDINVID